MKKNLLFISLFICALMFSTNAFAQMGITAVYDGPLAGGVPKGVELHVFESISDLSIYGLGSANNGGGSDGEEFTFPSVAITAGTYINVASDSAGFTSFFGFAPDYTSSAMLINGDDAVEVFKNGIVIDVFGDINVDGTGQAWEYLDGWAASDSARVISNTFTENEWTYSGPDALDGETTNGTAANPVPLGMYTLTPVELTSFTASVIGNSVTLNWATATELNNSGFEVQRSATENTWEKIAFVEGYGTTTETKNYSLLDNNLVAGQYSYRLKQIDFDGTSELSDVVNVEVINPAQYALSQNYPNPFNPGTTINFTLPEASNVTLKIFNTLGEEVSVLVNKVMEAGTHNVNFDASQLNSGIYFYRIEAGTFTQVRKMMLLK